MIFFFSFEPGFGGQSFLESMLPKIQRTRDAIASASLDISIQVDGGVSRKTIECAADAGATNFVAGSAIFRADDVFEEIATLRSLAQSHIH